MEAKIIKKSRYASMEQVCEKEEKPSMEPNQCGSWWSGYTNIQSVWKLVEEKSSPSSARTRIQPNTKIIEVVLFTFSKSTQCRGSDLGSRLATNVMMVVTTIGDRRWLDAVVPVVGDDDDGLETSGERSGH
ncbi:hypothetical protein L6452_22912 [Arctium lappa]|uniref:Uncharacterized protein n=1 Tax=Arctium lappa TaxID=4217 RepID=A0ACB9B0H6_ARCLA|nr:hypothetical protein L6452_22912 [Arctium lappa]